MGWSRPAPFSVAALTVAVAVLAIAFACAREPSPPGPAAGGEASPVATAQGEVAASPTPTPTPSPTPTAVFVPPPAILPTAAIPSPTPTRTPVAPYQEALDTVGNRTAFIRGRFALGAIGTEFISREELGGRLATLLEENRDEIALDQRLYRALGILGPDEDLFDLLRGIYAGSVLGYFDPKERRLVVVKDNRELTLSDVLTYVHEYTHALQQQHFDISATLGALRSTGDRAAAFRALVEGDATAAEVLYMYQYMTQEQRQSAAMVGAVQDPQAFEAAPHVIQRLATFPYTAGLEFVGSLLLSEGWDAVNRAYEDLPASTEQVLHPEAYLAGEGPIEVVLPELGAALGQGWTEIGRGTMGEFLLLAYLETGLPMSRASLASTGWGGDAYAVLAGAEGETVVAALFAWDSDAEAQEFFDAFREFMSQWKGAAWTQVEGDPMRLEAALDGQRVFVSLAGSDTLVVYAPRQTTLEATVAAVLGTR